MGHISRIVAVPPEELLDQGEQKVERAFRLTRTRLRLYHSTLASATEVQGNQPRKVFDSGTTAGEKQTILGERARSTFRAVFTEKTGPEWCNPNSPVPDLPALFFLTTSESLVSGIANQAVHYG